MTIYDKGSGESSRPFGNMDLVTTMNMIANSTMANRGAMQDGWAQLFGPYNSSIVPYSMDDEANRMGEQAAESDEREIKAALSEIRPKTEIISFQNQYIRHPEIPEELRSRCFAYDPTLESTKLHVPSTLILMQTDAVRVNLSDNIDPADLEQKLEAEMEIGDNPRVIRDCKYSGGILLVRFPYVNKR